MMRARDTTAAVTSIQLAPTRDRERPAAEIDWLAVWDAATL